MPEAVTQALLVASAGARGATPEVLTVAVFDFESKDEAVRDLGPKIATLINANLSTEPQIITVERADLDKILGEHELGLSGTVSAESAAKVGQLTGAKVLVTGRVFKVDRELVIVAKIIGTETSRVYGEMVKGTPAASPITDLSAELARKIGTNLNTAFIKGMGKREGKFVMILDIDKVFTSEELMMTQGASKA